MSPVITNITSLIPKLFFNSKQLQVNFSQSVLLNPVSSKHILGKQTSTYKITLLRIWKGRLGKQIEAQWSVLRYQYYFPISVISFILVFYIVTGRYTKETELNHQAVQETLHILSLWDQFLRASFSERQLITKFEATKHIYGKGTTDKVTHNFSIFNWYRK